VNRPRIAVIGGGVTGLAAAYELRDRAAVTIFEASDRLGGKVLTDEVDGIQVEAGPDSLLARDDGPLNLLTELGLDGDVVEPHDFGAWIAIDGSLKRLPPGLVLGVPAAPAAILRSGLLSPLGVMRAAADLVLPRRALDEDTSLGAVVRSRFGNQVTDRIVAPLMSGIRSGDIDEMSIEMAAPQIAVAARHNRSLMLGLQKVASRARPPRFIGLRRGMASLVEALRDRSGAEVLLQDAVRELLDDLKIDGRGFDGAVVAVPPGVAASVLGFDDLGSIRFSAASVTNLVYPAGGVNLPPSGTGILVAPKQPTDLVACTWFTRKWPHLAPDDGRVVVRCVGAPDMSADAAATAVDTLIGTSAPPHASATHRWDSALPEFKVGHRRVIDEITTRLAHRPIRLAGAGYLATGLNDCLAHGRAAAREILQLARP